jgi:Cys-tRNA(Pro)/Cys-tRNA(Cys) deacylase
MEKTDHPRVDDVLGLLEPSRFRIWQHAALGKPIRSAADFAHTIGVDLHRIAKTIVVGRRGWPPKRRMAEPVGAYAAVCLPSSRKIKLSAVAQTFGWLGCELATTVELEKLLGVSRNGVSPLALGQIPLIVDESLFSHSTMLVGGGAIGVDIELDPRDLVGVTNARAASIAVD